MIYTTPLATKQKSPSGTTRLGQKEQLLHFIGCLTLAAGWRRAMTDPIRAALERLIELNEECTEEQWTDAIAAARAALASDGPAVPESREPASVVGESIDDAELDELFTEIDQSGEALSWRAYARAVLSRWGHQPARLRNCPTHGQQPPEAWGCPECVRELREELAAARLRQPTPPAEGEVGELLAELEVAAVTVESEGGDHEAAAVRRAAELLQQQHPTPVPVSERLPEPNVKVLAYYFNGLGNGRTICAIWVPAKSRSEDSGDDDFTEYDEENDTYYWPEGWYEVIENWDDLGWVAVNEGEVAYWQPLPKWPALPLPQGEVEA